MSRRKKTLVLCLPFFALALNRESARAQTSLDDVHISGRQTTAAAATAAYSAAPADPSLIRTRADLVLVPVAITDDRNRPVVGLDQENFQVFENKRPQAIKNFSTEDTPVSIGILLDTSGSMSYKLDRTREALLQFCEEANPQDEFFLITFADSPQLARDFTTRADTLANDLLSLRSKGKTSLLDAVSMGLEKMRTARYARKALLIISDGGDNHSRFTEHDVKAAVRESDVTIYAVGTYDHLVSTQEESLGPELLADIAEATGGQAFSLDRASEMPDVTRAIGNRLRHEYVLAYQPGEPDGKWHKITVKLRLPRKFPFLHVNARPGYYAREENVPVAVASTE